MIISEPGTYVSPQQRMWMLYGLATKTQWSGGQINTSGTKNYSTTQTSSTTNQNTTTNTNTTYTTTSSTYTTYNPTSSYTTSPTHVISQYVSTPSTTPTHAVAAPAPTHTAATPAPSQPTFEFLYVGIPLEDLRRWIEHFNEVFRRHMELRKGEWAPLAEIPIAPPFPIAIMPPGETTSQQQQQQQVAL